MKTWTLGQHQRKGLDTMALKQYEAKKQYLRKKQYPVAKKQ